MAKVLEPTFDPHKVLGRHAHRGESRGESRGDARGAGAAAEPGLAVDWCRSQKPKAGRIKMWGS